jgi:5-methylcytosine-specific restriction endonuclease McrA
MSIMTQRKVLVLNRGWNPIAVVTLERAMALIWTDDTKGYKRKPAKARILDATQDFKLFEWNNPEKPDESWAHLIPKDDEPVIHSAHNSFRIPEIILLSRYNQLPQQRIHFSRRTIYRRDANTCQYCGCRPGTDELSIDHILPRSRGGKTTWENCVLACTICNKKKADRTPEECGMKLLKKPKKPHFSFYKGDYRCKSWEAILGVAYWETELQHDMGENA